MIDLEGVLELKKGLEEECSSRHDVLTQLRGYWHGQYGGGGTSAQGSTITTIFQDLVGDMETGPDIQIVNNLLFAIITKYQSFLSSAPMIRMYVDPPGGNRQRTQSNLKERYLYGTWAEGKMSQAINQMAWYLPLMGHAFLGAFPEIKRNIVCPVLRSPEVAYPIPSYDGTKLDAVIFCWQARESVIRRSFPNYQPKADRKTSILGRLGNRISGEDKGSDPMVWIYEYSDEKEWSRWIDDQKVNGVDHDYGFNLFEQAKFIDVPGERWGHGAAEQIVNQVELGNALESLLFQAVIDNVFPTLVLTDPSKAPETIDRGPGSVIPLNPGGKAEYLNAPVNMPAGIGMLQKISQDVKEIASMPDVSMGKFQGSIITGKAVNELQGAGTGSTVEMVQSNMGPALVGFNEKAIYLAQNMFKDEMIYLQGSQPQTASDINPRQFAFKAKGSQLVGSARNEVIFQPLMDLQTKTVMNLQLRGAGLVSKQYMREQVGIPDSQAMEEEIIAETISDQVLRVLLQAMDPNNPDATELAADTFLETSGLPKGGQAPPPGQLPPGLPGPGGGAPPPSTMLQAKLGSSGASATANTQQMLPSQGAPGVPTGGGETGGQPAPGATPSSGGTITQEQAISAIQALGDTPGRVFLVGAIVEQGQASTVDVALTDPASQSVIQSGVQFQVNFTVLSHGDTPDEQYVEVTPGTEPAAGGAPPDLASLGG